MAKTHSIAPFPADIDRGAFGHWLSGFTDGEGCFLLHVIKREGQRGYPVAHFKIVLRADDSDILQLIQSYFGCGRLWLCKKRDKGNGQAQSGYAVQAIPQLVKVILPHFERHPLRAKKRRDFAIWRQGVLLCHQVQQRPLRYSSQRGSLSRWADADRDEFNRLDDALKRQRLYAAPAINVQGQAIECYDASPGNGEIIRPFFDWGSLTLPRLMELYQTHGNWGVIAQILGVHKSYLSVHLSRLLGRRPSKRDTWQ